MGAKKGRLTGDDLRAATGKNIETIRDDAGIDPAAKAGLTGTLRALLRRFGSSLFVIATLAIAMWKDAKDTGAFDGLGFTLDDFTNAVNRMGDLDFVSADVGKLAKEAQSNSTASHIDVGQMLDKLLLARAATLAHPGDPKGIQATVQRAGQKVDDQLAKRRKTTQENRARNAAARSKDAVIQQQASRLHESDKKDAITEAQKDLKLQVYGGEALRPEDLVVADVPVTPTGIAETTGRKGRVRKGATTGTTGTSPRRGRKTTR